MSLATETSPTARRLIMERIERLKRMNPQPKPKPVEIINIVEHPAPSVVEVHLPRITVTWPVPLPGTPEFVGPMRPKPITILEIQRATCNHFKICRHELLSQRRCNEVIYPRHIALYLSVLLTGMSTPAIGRMFDHMDHTTVIHANQKIAAQQDDPHTAANCEAIVRIIGRTPQ